ncbi:MAG: hypothetical protein ACLSC9_07435 [Barnesiella sp.]
MGINNIFDPARFGKYYLKELNENKKSLLLQAVSFTLVLTIVLFMRENTLLDSEKSKLAFSFIYLIFLMTGAKYSSAFSKQIGLRSNKVMYLMVPSSTFEKFLTQIINITILFPSLFIASLFIAQYLSPLFYSLFWGGEIIFRVPFEGIYPYYGEDNIYGSGTILSFFYISTVSLFLLGATIWQKNSFLKTFISLIGIHVLFTICMSIFVVHTDLTSIINMISLNLLEADTEKIKIFAKLSYTLFILIIWIISYIRLSELEINETKW